MKKRSAAILAATLLSVVSTLWGESVVPDGPRPIDESRWWKDRGVARELELSAEQTSRIERFFLDYRLQLIDRRADLEREELRLQPMIDADVLDVESTRAQVEKVVRARGELEITNTFMMIAIRGVLSSEQWVRLRGIERERRIARAPRPPRAPEPPQLPFTPSATLPAPAPHPRMSIPRAARRRHRLRNRPRTSSRSLGTKRRAADPG